MTEALLARFVDDRNSLSEGELRELIAGMRSDENLAREVRDHLVFDELLSENLREDRADLSAQVRQRIRDMKQGTRSRESTRKFALEVIRAANGTTKPSGAWRRAVWGLLAIAAGIVIVLGMLLPRVNKERTAPSGILARANDMEGNAAVLRAGKSIPVSKSGGLMAGDSIRVREGESFSFAYDGGKTRVSLEGGTRLAIPSQDEGGRLHLETGRLVASVAKQPVGRPFVLTTPQSEITVVGTRFTTSVFSWKVLMRLEVHEGSVKLRAKRDNKVLDVGAGEHATVMNGVGSVGAPPTDRLPRAEILRELQVPDGVGRVKAIALQGTALWAASADEPMLFELDAEDGSVRRKLHLGAEIGRVLSLAWDGTHMWVLAPSPETARGRGKGHGISMAAVDLGSGKVVGWINRKGWDYLRGLRLSLTYGEGRLWLKRHGGRMEEIDPVGGDTVRTHSTRLLGTSMIAHGDGVLWSHVWGWIFRVDAGKEDLTLVGIFPPYSAPGDLAAAGGNMVWTVKGRDRRRLCLMRMPGKMGTGSFTGERSKR
jgi:ferric-dicitrate binding protein FerR (iron transport regulator)